MKCRRRKTKIVGLFFSPKTTKGDCLFGLAVLMVFIGGHNALASSETPANKDYIVDEMTVKDRADNNESYVRVQNKTATLTSTSFFDVPVSVHTISDAVMQDQAASRPEDIYRNVAGVVENGNTLNASSVFRPTIRGFESDRLLRNGMTTSIQSSADLFNVEQVDVLKGPSSILFGQLEPGGVLNFITKKPQADRHFSVEQRVGSWELSRTTIDAGGALLPESDQLMGRLNLIYHNSDSFRDHIEWERIGFAPSLTFNLTDRTSLRWDFLYLQEKTPYDSGVAFDSNGNPIVPIETFFGDPDLAGRDSEDLFNHLLVEHQIMDVYESGDTELVTDWNIRGSFNYHHLRTDHEEVRNRGVRAENMLRGRYQSTLQTLDEYQVIVDSYATVHGPNMEHEILMGWDYREEDDHRDLFRSNLANISIAAGSQFDVADNIRNSAKDNRQAYISRLRWNGIYFQDHMSLGPEGRLKALVGARYDQVRQEAAQPTTDMVVTHDRAWTIRAGLLYQLFDSVAPYYSYSESFVPVAGLIADSAGDPFSPEEGDQHELGIKFKFLEEKLTSTVSYYWISKEGVPEFDLNTFAYAGQGAQESEGFEIDVLANPYEGLNILFNYAYTDTKRTNSTTASNIGRPLGVPLHSSSLWVTYEVPESVSKELEGLGFGAGYTDTDSRYTEFSYDAVLPEWTRFDAAIWYDKEFDKVGNVRAQLNFNNIGDEEYYTSASDPSIVHPGEPFEVIASLRFDLP